MRFDHDPTIRHTARKARIASALAALLGSAALGNAQTHDAPLTSSAQFVAATSGSQDLLVDAGVTKVWLDVRQPAMGDAYALRVQPSGQPLAAVAVTSLVIPKTDMGQVDPFGGFGEVTSWTPPVPGAYSLDSSSPYLGMMIVEGGATLKFWIDELGADHLLAPRSTYTLEASLQDAAGLPIDGAALSVVIDQTADVAGARPAAPVHLSLALAAGANPGSYTVTLDKALKQSGIYTFSIEGRKDLVRRQLVTSFAVAAGHFGPVIPAAGALAEVQITDLARDGEQIQQALAHPDTKAADAPGTIFYYSEGNADFGKPVVVFVHGFNAGPETWFGDDGFTHPAIEANYRIAVVALHPDESFSTNAGLLSSAFPAIAAHYDVKKLVVVAHSKGGVDTDAAMTFGGMKSYVTTVVTLATPHWGSPLADLADSDWVWWLAEILGRRNNAQISMKVGSMAAFRDQVAHQPQGGTDFRTTCGWKYWDDPLAYYNLSGLYLKQHGGGNGNGGNDGVVNYRDSIRPGGREMFSGQSDSRTAVNHQGIHERNKYWAHVQAELLSSVFDNGPSAPSGLAASIQSDPAPGIVHLTWTDHSLHETGFWLERSTDGGPFVATSYAVPADFQQMWDSEAQPGHSYSYRLRSHLNDVWYSDYSNVASVGFPLPIPTAPAQLTAAALSSSSIRLTWVDSSSNETGFEVYRRSGGGFTLAGTIPANVVTWTNTGLQPATAYDYRVRAVGSGGASAYTSVVTATTFQVAPAAPSGLVASVLSPTSVRLDWADNSSNETQLEIQRRVAPAGMFAQLALATANATTFTDSTLVAGASYEYRVRASNAVGASAFSNVVPVTTTQPVPAAPSGMTASYDGMLRTIRLAWVDNSNNEQGFGVQFSYSGSVFSDLSPATVGANVTAWTSGANPPTGSYQFRVRAFANGLYSAWSNLPSLIVTNAVASTSIAWIQPAESSWGPAGTLTAAGYATNGSGNVQLVWRERSSSGVWGAWTTVAYQAPISPDTTWSNTIASGNPTNKCHWFDAYTNYAGATSPVFHFTGAPGCP